MRFKVTAFAGRRWSTANQALNIVAPASRPGQTSHDPQALGDSLRIAPKGVVDKSFEQVRRQQACAGFGLHRAGDGVQPRYAGKSVMRTADLLLLPPYRDRYAMDPERCWLNLRDS